MVDLYLVSIDDTLPVYLYISAPCRESKAPCAAQPRMQHRSTLFRVSGKSSNLGQNSLMLQPELGNKLHWQGGQVANVCTRTGSPAMVRGMGASNAVLLFRACGAPRSHLEHVISIL